MKSITKEEEQYSFIVRVRGKGVDISESRLIITDQIVYVDLLSSGLLQELSSILPNGTVFELNGSTYFVRNDPFSHLTSKPRLLIDRFAD